MFHRLPVRNPRIRVEAAQDRDSVGDIRTSGEGKEQQGTNSRDVGDLLHVLLVLRRHRSHGDREIGARDHGSLHKGRVGLSITLQHVQNVLALGEHEATIGAIPSNLYTKESGGGSQIAKLE